MSRRPIFAAALVITACSAAPDAEWTSTTGALTTVNGDNLNGDNLNGDNLNGDNLNGDASEYLRYTSFEGVLLQGSKLEQVWLEATEFAGRKGNGSIVRGTDFQQAEFQAVRGDGSAVRLRVAGIHPGAGGSADLWEYDVEYRETDGVWYPICEDGAGNRVRAVPVNGWWNPERGVEGGGAKVSDPSTFTFSCKGRGAVAKCVYIGYKPWTSVSGVNVDKHHQACVRLLRADFCGDGTPYTVDGTRVNLYDGLGIQLDTEDWHFESEWDENGARCFSRHNRSHEHVPCWGERATSACGKLEHFKQGTLLMNETETK